MLLLPEEEKLLERNANAVRRTIKDCSDIIACLINKLQDQTFEAVEKIKTSKARAFLAKKKRCEHLYFQLESFSNFVAVSTVDDTIVFIEQKREIRF
ncbi:hypothetical protein DPMN_037651 [Dreissena polymorpha]|uniref:Uncharacterized protein n=1 Tax=Dreissena polymorpha TaxID=45954 RepID=A0A9D4RPD7_DREPO|nr:hypothetical protein DPMN_037651 [Dreissena polymorpha]